MQRSGGFKSRMITMLAAVAMCMGAAGAAGKPVAKINASLTEGVAPLSVMFDALQSAPAEGGIVDYLWDLGDESPGNRRTERGWLAAHRYEKPGSYTVTLAVRDASGATAETAITISVREWEGKTFYFSATEGDDARSAEQAQDPATPWKTVSKLAGELNDAEPGTRFLLKRGDVFESGRSVELTKAEPGNPKIVGAFGDGPPPIIKAPAGRAGLSVFRSGGLVLQDLHLQGTEESGAGILGYSRGGPGIRHLTLRRLTVEGFHIGLHFSIGAESEPNRYIIVEDCLLQQNYFTGWLAGYGDHFVVRNTELAHNGVHLTKHHNMYFKGDVFLIEDNYTHHASGAGFNTHHTSDTIIRRNRIHSNGIEQGTGIGIAWDQPGNVVHHLLVEGNDFYDNGLICWAKEDKGKAIPNDVTFRNNVFRENRKPVAYSSMDGLRIYNNTFYLNRGIDIAEGGGQVCRDVVIANNIFYKSSENAVFRRSYGDSYGPADSFADVGHVTWSRNLVFVPGADAGQCIVGWLQAVDRRLAFDAWRALMGDEGALFADPGFVDADGGDFRLGAGSPALDAGAPDYAPPYDYDGAPRPQGPAPDLGAFERTP